MISYNKMWGKYNFYKILFAMGVESTPISSPEFMGVNYSEADEQGEVEFK